MEEIISQERGVYSLFRSRFRSIQSRCYSRSITWVAILDTNIVLLAKILCKPGERFFVCTLAPVASLETAHPLCLEGRARRLVIGSWGIFLCIEDAYSEGGVLWWKIVDVRRLKGEVWWWKIVDLRRLKERFCVKRSLTWEYSKERFCDKKIVDVRRPNNTWRYVIGKTWQDVWQMRGGVRCERGIRAVFMLVPGL